MFSAFLTHLKCPPRQQIVSFSSFVVRLADDRSQDSLQNIVILQNFLVLFKESLIAKNISEK